MNTIKIDGTEYDLSKASDNAKVQLDNLKVVSELILQKNNELQIAQTAKIGYTRALKREIESHPSNAKD